MDTENSHVQDNEFPPSPWVDMGAFHPSQHSPSMDYQAFAYGVMPMDAGYGVSVPPAYTSLPLTLPSNNAWPSMLTTTSPQFPEVGLPPVPFPVSVPPPTPIVPPPRKTSTSSSTPRRTLTDEDRRRMCLYHEEHKTAKQTDIGALFGVERSTVSKVLRQKEKYLNLVDDGGPSPIKKAKGKVPDIEKALTNWAKNCRQQGHPITDTMIREKASFFSATCGGPEGEELLTASWLEKFKSKNNLTDAKSRKGSFAKSDSGSPRRLSINSNLDSAVHSPTVLSPTVLSPTVLSPTVCSPTVFSPTSPTALGQTTPSPLSPSQSQENMRRGLLGGLADISGNYQQNHAKSTTSLDTTTSSLSASLTSPTSTLSPFTPTSQSHNSSADVHSNRPRSQTLPASTVDPNAMCTDDSCDPLSPKTGLQQSVESPFEESRDPKYVPTLDTSANTIKRNRSNPEIKTKSIYPPLFSKSNTVSPISSPGSPTQDEARRALELVMSYFEQQPSGLGAQEYVTIGKLMERLELAKAQQITLPGGLTRIDEQDDIPRVSKKRSIRSLG